MLCKRAWSVLAPFHRPQSGSSRVLTIGRMHVVCTPVTVSNQSARCESWYGTCPAPCSVPTFPAPVIGRLDTWNAAR